MEDGGWVDIALFLGVLDVGGTLPPLRVSSIISICIIEEGWLWGVEVCLVG